MRHAAAPRSGLKHRAAGANTQTLDDEGDVGEVEDLRAVREGQGPQLGRGPEEVDVASVWWGGK